MCHYIWANQNPPGRIHLRKLKKKGNKPCGWKQHVHKPCNYKCPVCAADPKPSVRWRWFPMSRWPQATSSVSSRSTRLQEQHMGEITKRKSWLAANLFRRRFRLPFALFEMLMVEVHERQKSSASHDITGRETIQLELKVKYSDAHTGENAKRRSWPTENSWTKYCQTTNEIRCHLLIQTRQQVFLIHWIVIILSRCCSTCNDQRSFTFKR